MIEFVFTIDYEIYGNGQGSLEELVYQPARRLQAIFEKWDARFVAFIEAAELEKIEACETDPAISLVKGQIRDFQAMGHELGLHLHPQWCNARHENGGWRLDYEEYTLCTLPRERIARIVDQAIGYLRRLLGRNDFQPLSFRAGNWLFQPTRTVAETLFERGLKVDSSVFKGGRQHQYGLDYRGALKNGYFWPFRDDVNRPDPRGTMLEFPIYTKMVPAWKMATAKRVGLQGKATASRSTRRERVSRLRDFLRFRHPLKLDFCRLTMGELTGLLDAELRADRTDPTVFRPIVAIGHTKDLVDFETVERLLSYLRNRNVKIATLAEALGSARTFMGRADGKGDHERRAD